MMVEQNPSYHDSYALRIVVESGHTDIVKLLLDDGRVNPVAEDNYAIKTAVSRWYTDIVTLLRKYLLN